jgi:hypothetical protein
MQVTDGERQSDYSAFRWLTCRYEFGSPNPNEEGAMIETDDAAAKTALALVPARAFEPKDLFQRRVDKHASN